MLELTCFVFACVLILAKSVLLGLRSKGLVENGLRRTVMIKQRKQELEEQLVSI